ncbi:hypothetical protein SAMN06264364_12115 [Quadrisphaera granulorum]|uniref:Uncharacterized protein n=1 Tax=Quadrisphaera granulorum TaxID=317664 RepID=A0A316A1M9_9ACTN|nr:hypothetical protein BXY45_12115 [Quadrisphaera granulorum]SZE97788.1 hypothetical protein SAMN06264364_12115 [Quadrisphaera granulorum]
MGPCGAQLLGPGGLRGSYADAFAEWDASGEGESWETATADGLDEELMPHPVL